MDYKQLVKVVITRYVMLTGITTLVTTFAGTKTAYSQIKCNTKKQHSPLTVVKYCFASALKSAGIGIILPIIFFDYSLFCITGYGLPFIGPYTLCIRRD